MKVKLYFFVIFYVIDVSLHWNMPRNVESFGRMFVFLATLVTFHVLAYLCKYWSLFRWSHPVDLFHIVLRLTSVNLSFIHDLFAQATLWTVAWIEFGFRCFSVLFFSSMNEDYGGITSFLSCFRMSHTQYNRFFCVHAFFRRFPS